MYTLLKLYKMILEKNANLKTISSKLYAHFNITITLLWTVVQYILIQGLSSGIVQNVYDAWETNSSIKICEKLDNFHSTNYLLQDYDV